MARLSYGGNPSDGAYPGQIDLDIVDTLGFRRVPHYDGRHYLYTEFILDVSAVLSPAATAYTQQAVGAEPVRRAQADQLGALTDTVVRDWLLRPQRKLFYKVGRQTVLESPRAGFAVDAASGPFPTHCTVTKVAGWKTLLVNWGCRTFVNESHLRTGAPSPLLSNSWRRERDIDQDGLTTLITQGRAVFDMARLTQASTSPDDYLPSLVFPIERNFRRDHIQVTVSEDGAELSYVTVDREMPINMVSQGISRVQAFHSATVSRGPVEDQLKGIPRVLTKVRKAWKEARTTIGGLFEGGAVIGEEIITRGIKLIPTTRHLLNCKVWGKPTTPRDLCERTAINLIANRITPLLGVHLHLMGFENSITHDLGGRYAEATASFTTGPATKIGTADVGRLGQRIVFPLMPAADGTPPTLLSADLNNEQPLLNDAGTRGRYLGALLAQALAQPGSTPASPAAPRQRQVLVP